ncbi:MAG: hypothetical protein IPL53_14620 [Ignavibacteria bacterium]|nr:hypothetical protein [Ignavibacteria bacterium]
MEISESKLSSILNCKVVSVNGITGKGIDNLLTLLKENISEFNSEEANNLIHKPLAKHKDSLLESYSEIEK